LQILRVLFEIIAFMMNAFMLALLSYQLVLSIFGFRKGSKDYSDYPPEARFLILVPAHNEEKVIRDIIENLQNMSYPKELYDFYIIADNCTDSTESIAVEMNANVIVTIKENEKSPTGKPIAIKKALETITNYKELYDLVMLFDADNLVDKNMLTEVNSQYLDKGKPEIIQSYLGVKNNNGLVAWFYYTCFTAANRFTQLSRTRRGLNCGIGGTGYAVSTSYLHERGGWTAMSLTEDFELQIDASLSGKRILWNHNVRVYDEKPTSYKVSLHQRIRWAQGQWFVVLKNTSKLVRAIRTKTIPVREALSLFMYMYGLFANVFVVFQLLLGLVYLLTGWYDSSSQPWYLTTIQICVFLYSFIVLFCIAEYLDNKQSISFRSVTKIVISVITNFFLALIAQITGLLLHRRQNEWVKTEHYITKNNPAIHL